MARLAILLLGLLVLVPPPPARAQQRPTLPDAWTPAWPPMRAIAATSPRRVDAALRRTRPAAMLGGVAGSALGLWVGLEFGDFAFRF
jgi:hypothetical protein